MAPYILVAALAAGLAFSIQVAHAATPHHYLVSAANRIVAIYFETGRPAPYAANYGGRSLPGTEIEQIADLGCSALGQLLNDPVFQNSLADALAPELVAKAGPDAATQIGNPEIFYTDFLPAEQKVLTGAGMSVLATSETLVLLSRYRDLANPKELSAQRVTAAVVRGHSRICGFVGGGTPLRYWMAADVKTIILGLAAVALDLLAWHHGALASPVTTLGSASAGLALAKQVKNLTK